MNRIAVLLPDVARRIAAGEVIERPVSVVKELVENALDAGAAEISIEVRNGGKSLIRVRDDGCGMSRADAEICFARHATSKISTDADLSALTTLGFRGEALASISAVSRLTLKTSEGGAEPGTLVEREGDEVRAVRDIAFPRGTEVEVRDLFFNLPARLKFLRGDQAELGPIAKFSTLAALAFPGLKLTLVHGERTVLDVPPADGLGGRIFQLYGPAHLGSLMSVDASRGGLRLQGFVSRPPAGRADRAHQFFFVNRRPVQDKVLASALAQAFRGRLEKDRWPEAFLFLTVPPEEVDVNIHPAKSEVRFRNSSDVFQIVLQAAGRAAEREAAVKGVAPAAPPAGAPPAGVAEAAALFGPGTEPSGTAAGPARAPAGAPARRVLGQYADSYIVAADEEGLLVIDQHNAHERVLYERYADIDRRRAWPRTISLLPLLVDLSPAQTVAYEAGRDLLEAAGFRAERLSGRTHALREYPDIFRPEEALAAFVALLEEPGTGRDGGKKERLLATLACRTAIKAGQPLPPEKMAFLVEALFQTSNPAVCPHGRPIVVRLGRSEIEKGLGRVRPPKN